MKTLFRIRWSLARPSHELFFDQRRTLMKLCSGRLVGVLAGAILLCSSAWGQNGGLRFRLTDKIDGLVTDAGNTFACSLVRI